MKTLWIPWWLLLAACATHKAAPIRCDGELRPINTVAASSAAQPLRQSSVGDHAP